MLTSKWSRSTHFGGACYGGGEVGVSEFCHAGLIKVTEYSVTYPF
jgi:hypothetical protein